MQARPVNAFVLSLLGSLFVLLGTVLSLVLGATSFSFYSILAVAFTAVSGLLGVVMLFAAIMLFLRPDLHVAWGVAVLVVSVGSFTSVFGGFARLGLRLVGMVLGIVGGALGTAWTPGGEVPTSPFRVCLSCGRPYHGLFAFCPHCGAAAPSFPLVAGGMPPPQPPAARP